MPVAFRSLANAATLNEGYIKEEKMPLPPSTIPRITPANMTRPLATPVVAGTFQVNLRQPV